MKNQVLSIEQMQHLKELGVDTSKASCFWYFDDKEDYLFWGQCTTPSGVPTLTLQDMLEMIADIPNFYKIKIAHEEDDGWCFGVFGEIKYINDYQTNLLDLTYQTLCWLAENGYLKGGEK
jgi:hypothetical protein